MFKRSQIGRSMIEMLGVLAIIGILSIGGLSAYSRAMTTIKVNEAVEYLNRLKMEIKIREVSGTMETGSSTHKCVDLIDQDLPIGMTRCQYLDGRHPYYGGRLFIRFSPGETLKKFAEKINTHNLYDYTDEELTSGTVSILTYRPSGSYWWAEYNKYTGYVD